MRRQGSDVALMGYGTAVNECLAAADILAKSGIKATVADMRWGSWFWLPPVLATFAEPPAAACLWCGRGSRGALPGSGASCASHEVVAGSSPLGWVSGGLVWPGTVCNHTSA